MKSILFFTIIIFTLVSCEKSELKADNEFYNQSLDTQIKGYEIWAKEAEEFADKNKWAQKIDEPLIGYFEIVYSKKKKSNSDIDVKLNYVLPVSKALETLEKDAILYNYNSELGELRAGFYFQPPLGLRVFQTWTIPYDSLFRLKTLGVDSMTIAYDRYTTKNSEFRETNGNLLIVNMNSVNKLTIFQPSQEIYVYSSYGSSKSNLLRSKYMVSPKKIKDF